jgi:YVTN family beta-propeller protein
MMKKSLLLALAMGSAACGNSEKAPSPDTNAPEGSANVDPTHPLLFVVNGGDGTLSVLDVESNTVTGSIDLGDVEFPHHVSISRDGATLMVAVPGMDFSKGHEMGGSHTMPGAVLKVDVASGKVVQNKALPLMNHNAAFSPDGTEVWTAQMGMPGSVLILKADTLEQVTSLPLDHMPTEVTFAADGNTAFVANEMTNDVSVIDVAKKTVITKVYVAEGPVGAWPGSNNVMYVDSEEGQAITAIDGATHATLNSFPLGFAPGMAALAPDSTLWVSDSTGGAVVIFDPKTGKSLGKIPTAAGTHAILFAPDGKRAYISNQTANSVSIIDVAAKAVLATVPVGKLPNGLAFRQAR